MWHLAKKLGANNFELGIFLRVDADSIKAIEKNYRDDVVRCAFEILNSWRQRNGDLDSVATYNTLRQVLCDLERADLVEFLSSSE